MKRLQCQNLLRVVCIWLLHFVFYMYTECAKFVRRPFPRSSVILLTERQNDRRDSNPDFRINPHPVVYRRKWLTRDKIQLACMRSTGQRR